MKRIRLKKLTLELGDECTPGYLAQTDGLMIDSRAVDTGEEAEFFLPFDEISKALRKANHRLVRGRTCRKGGAR